MIFNRINYQRPMSDGNKIMDKLCMRVSEDEKEIML